MSVTADDLKAPAGELRAEWFTDFDTEVGVWITLGGTRVPVGASAEQADAVVTAYAYWRGFSDLLLRMSADPNSVSLDKGDISAAWSKDQRDQVANKVAEWKDAFLTAVSDAETAAVVQYQPPRPSASVPAYVSF